MGGVAGMMTLLVMKWIPENSLRKTHPAGLGPGGANGGPTAAQARFFRASSAASPASCTSCANKLAACFPAEMVSWNGTVYTYIYIHTLYIYTVYIYIYSVYIYIYTVYIYIYSVYIYTVYIYIQCIYIYIYSVYIYIYSVCIYI